MDVRRSVLECSLLGLDEVFDILWGCHKLFAQPKSSTTRKERAVSDEQKFLFEGGKKGFAKNTKLDFLRR